MAHPGNRAAGTGEVYKMHDPPERVCLASTWSPEGLDMGGHKTHSPLGICPCGAPENLSELDLGSSGNGGATWVNALAGCPGA